MSAPQSVVDHLDRALDVARTLSPSPQRGSLVCALTKARANYTAQQRRQPRGGSKAGWELP